MLVGKDIGPYSVELELGTGAMGTVYRAVRRDTSQRVAIKEIAYGLLGNDTAVERFEREGEILKQLKHPNIVRFIGTGAYRPAASSRKTPFFIMEYVEGDSLDKILLRRGAFPWDEVVVLGRQLCAALEHAHSKGIIHRDLKPSNLMILKDGLLKLTDFGIAKGADLTTLTGTNCTVGTAAYMSPEQCRGEKTLSAKSDLYSMGVVFYELLTGRKPFQKDSPLEMFHAHVYDKVERPSRTVMDIPVWLDTLVCQLLEKKPEHRPYDAAMVAKVLDEVEQKVADQRSAGVDAATARTTDRGVKRPTDETDRDAARTLRSAVAKKKPRLKDVPLTQRKWFQAVMLSSALVGLVVLVYALTRPPSQEKLFQVARDAFEAKDPQALTATHNYLAYYSTRQDESTSQVRAWDRELRVQRRESQLLNRVFAKRSLPAEDELQKTAYDAIKRENEGDLDEAASLWRDLEAKAKDATDSDSIVYAWLAQKKLNDLKAIPVHEKRLADAVEAEHSFDPAASALFKDMSSVERQCVQALRYESFGDLPGARDAWDRLKSEDVLKDASVRQWGVLAAYRAAKLKDSVVGGRTSIKDFRLKLLRDKLAEAMAIPSTADPNDRRKAWSICRDIVALYEKDADPQVNELVRKADQLTNERHWNKKEN
jgi:serine/threonine-protein kinase